MISYRSNPPSRKLKSRPGYRFEKIAPIQLRPSLQHLPIRPVHAGKGPSTPLPWARKPNGNKGKPAQNKGKALNPRDRDEVIRLYQRGLRPRMIGAETGLSRGRINGYIFRYRKLHGEIGRGFRG